MRAYLSVFLLSALGWASGAQAQLTPDHVARIQSVNEVAMQPSGEHVAYTVSVPADPREANATARRQLWVREIASGTSRMLAGIEVNASDLGWTPDGARISFRARLDGDASMALYVHDPASGETVRAFAHPTGVGAYEWSPDGSQVAFIAATPVPEDNGLPYQPRIYEEADRQRPVYIGTAFTDAMAQPLFEDGTAYALDWHPDGDRLAVMVAPDPLVDSRYVRQTVRVYSASGEVVAEVEHRGKKGSLAWSPDGDALAFLAGANINDPAVGRLFVVSASGGEPTDVIPGFEGHVSAFFWDDEDEIDFLASVGTETMMGEVDVMASGDRVRFSEAETEVEPGQAIWTAASSSAEGNPVALIGHTPEHPPEMYLLDGDEVSRVTMTNPWLADVRLARQETVRHTARDGVELEGVMIYPLEETDEPSPLVLLVHGGPEAHVSNGWVTTYSRPGQTLAARGIAAFYPNYRGSTGRGVAFTLLSQGDPAGTEFDDLADARDHFVASGVAQEDAVGIAGGSYGGYATAWGSTYYSEKFAAGVMFVGISNKVSKVGTTDIPDEEFYVHARKRPWDNWTYFLERSPIYYADQQRTPLLIAHGEDDPRVDPGQSMEMYRHLKLRGQAPVRLVFYPGEGHGNRRATAQLDFHLRTLRWFEHYLQGPGGEPPALDLTPLLGG